MSEHRKILWMTLLTAMGAFGAALAHKDSRLWLTLGAFIVGGAIACALAVGERLGEREALTTAGSTSTLRVAAMDDTQLRNIIGCLATLVERIRDESVLTHLFFRNEEWHSAVQEAIDKARRVALGASVETPAP